MAIAPLVTNPINNITTGNNTSPITFSLVNHFDDPSTTGLIAQFRLYNTTLGNGIINVLLFDQAGVGAPLNTQNFLNYVTTGVYNNTIIHRSLPGFVIQGGGFRVNNLSIETIPKLLPVQNEFSPLRSNLRGTIAMAKVEGDPNSATSEWFFNLGDNSANLDNQNGGFTVFGQVLSDQDLAPLDAIANLPVFNGTRLNPAFTNLPLTISSTNPTLDQDDDFVRYQTITLYRLPELQFSLVRHSNPSLVNITLQETQLQIEYLPRQVGTTEITLRSTTLLGQSIEYTFSLTVFDPAQYGASHPDLIMAYGNDLAALNQHYLTQGKQEVRVLDTFDEGGYLASYDDLLTVFKEDLFLATEHYLRAGFFEQRRTDLFNPSQYLASYDDLLNAFGNNLSAATTHFIQNGFLEGRSRDIFAEDIYLASYGDLIETFGYNLEAATQHYLTSGIREGRSKALFDPLAYLNKYVDLQAAFGDNLTAATQHYIQTGYEEGRRV